MNIEKLPKKVQEYIEDLKREKETAIKALNDFLDSKTPSSIYIEDLLCLGESNSGGPTYKKRYIQGNKISCQNNKITMNIIAYDNNIDIRFGSLNHNETIYIQLQASNSISIVSKERDN